MQVWVSGLGQVLDSCLGLKFVIHVWNSGLGFR